MGNVLIMDQKFRIKMEKTAYKSDLSQRGIFFGSWFHLTSFISKAVIAISNMF